MEQYRIYEALECGSIPVIAREDGYSKERLPPEFHVSPAFLFVDDWTDAPAAMNAIVMEPHKLLERQAALAQWYFNYMRGRIMDIEDALIGRVTKTAAIPLS